MANTQIGNTVGVIEVQGTASQSEVQTVTGGATSGNFKLRFGTQETANIAFNASAATIQTALRNLSNISATGVACSGGPLNTTPVVCTFGAEYAAVDVPTLVVVNVDLAGGTVTAANTTAMASGPFFDSDMSSIAAMRTRLTAIDGTLYASAYLDKMSYNDMKYALRQHDAPQTIF